MQSLTLERTFLGSSSSWLPTRRAQGLTLVELLVVMLLAALLAAMAAPSFSRWVETRHLHDTAQAVNLALHHARAAAMSRQERVSASLMQGAEGLQCHVVHVGPAAGCRCMLPVANCNEPTQVLLATVVPASHRLQLSSTASSIHFDPRVGTATPAGRVVVRSRSGREVHNVANAAGRVRKCSLSSSSIAELDHASCPNT
jgi:type IV fimbrial biogenesis protein FimT